MKRDGIQVQDSDSISNQRLLEEKQRYCQLWKESGLSKKEFSKQNKFSAKTLSNWIKAFANGQTKVKKLLPPFVPLVAEESSHVERQSVTIQFSNGLCCHFEDAKNIALIVKLTHGLQNVFCHSK